MKSVIDIGTWDMERMGLRFNDDNISWNNENNIPPTSICATDCLIRQFKIQLELKCCWECRLIYNCIIDIFINTYPYTIYIYIYIYIYI